MERVFHADVSRGSAIHAVVSSMFFTPTRFTLRLDMLRLATLSIIVGYNGIEKEALSAS